MPYKLQALALNYQSPEAPYKKKQEREEDMQEITCQVSRLATPIIVLMRVCI